MTVTMNALVTKLSKQIDDWKEFTAASGSTSTVVANAIAQEQDNFISSGSGGQVSSTVYVKTDAGGSSAAPEGEERVVASKTTTTITTNTTNVFSAAIGAGDIVEVHRKFSRREKEEAIAEGCKRAFPYVYKEVQDRSIVFDDWLVNGGNFPKWSQTTYPDSWTKSTLTCSKNTTEQYIFGLPTEYSLKLDAAGSAGSVYQSVAENNDLWMLAGKDVTFYAWVYTTGANEVSLGITDGTTTSYGNHTTHSSTTKVYHPGDSTWRLMWVTQSIATNPTAVTFTIYYDTASASAYVCRVHAVASGKYSYDLSVLGLEQDSPSQIFRLIGADANNDTPEANPQKIRIDGYSLSPNGKVHFTQHYGSGTRLEVVGAGYLTTPVSTYNGGTAVSTEISDIDREGEIVIAEAIKYLYEIRLNSHPSQDVGRTKELIDYWDLQVRDRRRKYSMKAIPVTRRW